MTYGIPGFKISEISTTSPSTFPQPNGDSDPGFLSPALSLYPLQYPGYPYPNLTIAIYMLLLHHAKRWEVLVTSLKYVISLTFSEKSQRSQLNFTGILNYSYLTKNICRKHTGGL